MGKKSQLLESLLAIFLEKNQFTSSPCQNVGVIFVIYLSAGR
jgi:hypothetical protein